MEKTILQAETTILQAETTDDNIRELFANPELKKAVDAMWQQYQIPKWIKGKAEQMLEEVMEGMSKKERDEVLKKLPSMTMDILMKFSLEAGIERLIAAHGEISLVEAVVKAIECDGKEITELCKNGFEETLEDLQYKKAFVSLIDLLLG